MGLTSIDDNKSNGQPARNEQRGRDRDMNADNNGRGRRTQEERDRDQLDQDYTTLRQAAANSRCGNQIRGKNYDTLGNSHLIYPDSRNRRFHWRWACAFISNSSLLHHRHAADCCCAAHVYVC